MAAETELKIQVDVDGTRKLDRLERKIRSLERTVDKLGMKSTRVFRDYGKTMEDTIGKSSGKWKKHFDDLDGLIKKFGTATLGGLKLALKAAGAEMALMAVSMVALHGLFKAGQGLVKTYEGLLNVLSGAAAGAAVALASVSAALREQNAAMFAFRGNAMKGYDGFVTGLNKVRVVMRGLHRDQVMAAAGAANLDAAFAAVSRKSTFTGGSQSMLRQLMDFAAAGGDIKKGMTSAGDLIGSIQEGKKDWKGIAEGMGQPMKDAMKELQITTAEGFQKALASGQLAQAGGVTGQWGAVSGTLISQFKLAFTTIKNDFADLGQVFLKPLKEKLQEVTNTFRDAMNRVWGPLIKFGHGPFLDSIGGMAEKISDMFVSLVRRGPEVEGMFKRIGDRWNGFVEGWNNVLDRLRPMIDGARVLEGMFGEMFGSIGDYIRESFGRFNELLQENEPQVRKFGERLGELFASFGRFQNELKELFFQALPFINRVLQGVRNIVDVLGSVIRGARGIMGAVGDGAGAYGLMAGAMVILSKLRSWAGGFLFQKQTNTMNVTAQSVNVGGAPVGGTGGAFGATGVTSGGQMSRAQMEQQGMRSMSYGQRIASDNRAMQHQAMMSGGPQPTWVQRQIGSRWRAMRQPSEAMRGRISGSMGTRMGLGMGLGMLSSRVDEESQGVMGLGAAASFVNPFIGAGIAGLGLAHTSGNATQAVLGGVGGGAAMGMQVAGPWGALGGAIVGGIYGGIMSGINKRNRERKQAIAVGQEIADMSMTNLGTTLDTRVQNLGGMGASALTPSAIRATYDSTGTRPLMAGIGRFLDQSSLQTEAAADEILQQIKDSGNFTDIDFGSLKNLDMKGTAISSFYTASSDIDREMYKTLDVFQEGMDQWTEIFGEGEEGIIAMAAAVDVDLMTGVENFGYVAQQLSKDLINNWSELNAAIAGDRVGMSRHLRSATEAASAPSIVNENAQLIADILNQDELSVDDENEVRRLMDSSLSAFVSLKGGDDYLGMLAFQAAYGQGGGFYDTGYQGEGTRSTLMGISGIEGLFGMVDQSVTDNKSRMSQIVLSNLLAAGVGGAGISDIFTQIGGIPDIANSGILNSSFYIDDQSGDFKSAADIQTALAALGINVGLNQMTEAELAPPMDVFETAVGQFADSVNKFIREIDPDSVRRDNDGTTGFGPTSDTTTPRRGMLKMRGLLGSTGSSQSDHLFGGAFDMTGSGLGSQMTAIRNAGGYADMHGRGRTRHLHAVPGQVAGGGEEGNYYTINVVGGDNASPAEIADEVMSRISRRSVDTYERS